LLTILRSPYRDGLANVRGWRPINLRSNSGRDLTNEAYAYGMGATRPHNPAARGELLGAAAPCRNRSRTKKNKPTLNTKLRILPVSEAVWSTFGRDFPQISFSILRRVGKAGNAFLRGEDYQREDTRTLAFAACTARMPLRHHRRREQF
jgi:hypothetical protein